MPTIRRTGRYSPSHAEPLSTELPARFRNLADESAYRSGAVRRGFAWTAFGNIAIQGIQFVAFIFLARLLGPASFGLAAMVSVFVAFAQLLTDLGLGSALIQIRTLVKSDMVAAFWVNLLSGVVLTLLTFALSDPLASAFHHPELVNLYRVAGLTFSLSFGIVQLSLLERALRFRLIMGIELFSVVLGYGIALIAAYRGAGTVSIILGPLLMAATMSLLLWSILPLNPFSKLTRESLRNLWSRGGSVTGFNIATFWARNTDNILLGRLATTVDLGYYSRAYSIMMAPIFLISGALGRVLLPALSRLSDSREAMSAEYLGSLRMASASMFPLLVLVASVATSLSGTIFGPAWLPMGTILAVLAASGPPQIITGTTGSVYQACGQSKTLLRRGGLLAIVTVLATVAGLPWGATGVAWALLIRQYVFMPYAMSKPLAMVGLSWGRLFAGLRGVIIATLALAVTAVGVGRLVGGHGLAALVSATAAGSVAYVLVLGITDRPLVDGLLGRFYRRRPGSVDSAAASPSR